MEYGYNNGSIWRKWNFHVHTKGTNKNDPLSGIQKIFHQSPVGHSIMGHAVGDIVKIGNMDNYVEIMKVVNS